VSYTRECGDRYYLKGELNDECIECKMEKGLAPGQQTGFDAWANEVKSGDVAVVVDSPQRGDGNASADHSNAGLDEVETRDRSASVASVDPRLLVRGNRRPSGDREGSADVSGIQEKEDDFEVRLRAVFAPEPQAQSSSTVDSGYTDSSAGRGLAFNRQVSPLRIFREQKGSPLQTIQQPASPLHFLQQQVSPRRTASDGFHARCGGNRGFDEEVPVTMVDGTMDDGKSMRIRAEVHSKPAYRDEDVDDWMWGGMRGFDDRAA
jgi:hypothetical protein